MATRKARSRSSLPEFIEAEIKMAVKVPIFMDNHSTTPVDPRVLDAMMPFFREDFGNAASRNHVFGWRAEKAVEIALELRQPHDLIARLTQPLGEHLADALHRHGGDAALLAHAVKQLL